MYQHGDGSKSKWPGRLYKKCLRILLIVFFVMLGVYTVIVKEIHPVRYVESWNFTEIFQNAVYKWENAMKRSKMQRERKLVLLWTDYFSDSDWLPSTEDLKCPVTECDVTSNRSRLPNSSAVVLHWRNINAADLPQCVPSETVSCPLWVLFNKEAPPHTPREALEIVQDRIHWTVTYRRDSDIYAPYGKIVPKRMRSSLKTDFNFNRRLLCWLVSNCDTPSKREVFVNELKNYIDVGIYGKCGTMKCPHKAVKDCYRWLSDRCMFYLSFENSICRDYTTEKLYNALSTDMVPVVIGNSSNYKHLPYHSVVNIEFSSPKKLAEYLVRLSKDKNEYISYFRWKRDYDVQDQSFLWYCDLCKKLHDTEPKTVKPGRNLMSWWFDQAGCTGLSD